PSATNSLVPSLSSIKESVLALSIIMVSANTRRVGDHLTKELPVLAVVFNLAVVPKETRHPNIKIHSGKTQKPFFEFFVITWVWSLLLQALLIRLLYFFYRIQKYGHSVWDVCAGHLKVFPCLTAHHSFYYKASGR